MKLFLVTAMMFCLFSNPILAKDVPDVSVTQLSNLMQAKKVTVIDANGPETRKKYGVIPGAVMLSSYDDYNIAKELPKDKNAKLVFYCANTKCTAAPKAAQKAIKAGYKNVAHLSVGIMGWNKAGKKNQKMN